MTKGRWVTFAAATLACGGGCYSVHSIRITEPTPVYESHRNEGSSYYPSGRVLRVLAPGRCISVVDARDPKDPTAWKVHDDAGVDGWIFWDHGDWSWSCANVRERSDSLLDPSVSSVVSGGYWEQGAQRGHYRIVVRRAGWEHVSSSARFEWIVEDPEKQQTRVLASSSVDSIPDWGWSLGTPHLACAAAGCQVTIEGTEPHLFDEARWVVTLRGPGRLTATKVK